MLVAGERYAYPADIWSLGLVLLEIEATEAACPTRPGASDWEQLRVFWRLCQPAAAETSGFPLSVRQELVRQQGWPMASGRVRLRTHVGQLYGPRFRTFAFRLLDFGPQQRVAAQTLSASCQLAFQHMHNVPLSCLWFLWC